MEEERHRKAVLGGNEEPTADDREWLSVEAKKRMEEAQAFAAAADEARKAAEKLSSI